ncbi:MAG: hypothetical protein ORN51_12290 [Akkermansiaceae bacterium]|nr:hypothetical protein [Akkermansiaceae bacterium]
MSRTALPYFLHVILCGACVFAWKNLTSRATLDATPAPAALAPLATPQPNRLAFLTNIGLPYEVRITQLRNTLATECSESEIRFLYQLLEKAPPRGELPEQWYVIANDIMTQILAHETDPQRFSNNFIGILNSPHQPEVIRDHSVQFLATWLNPRAAQATTSSLPTASPEIAGQVLESLAAAAIDPSLEHSTIPSTTLMTLVDLKRSDSGVDCRQAISTLKPWLGRALQDGSTLSNSIRVCAVAAAGILAPEVFRPAIRYIAYQGNGGSSLRLPAITALGQAGDEADFPKLRQIASSSPDLNYAAQNAADSLASRLGLAVPK